MVQQQASAVALFYATLSQTESAKKKKQKKKTIQAREKGWRTGGNELHNLPPLFIENGGKSPDCPIEGSWKPMGKSTNPRNTYKKNISHPPRVPLNGDLSRLRDVGPVIVVVISFLSRKDLISAACTCWSFCYYTRPVVNSRVQFRLATVEKCENDIKSESGISIVEATKMVQGVTRSSIEEVRKLNRSSEVVHKIGEAVSLCLGCKNPSWASFMKLAQEPNILHNRMVNYQRNLLTTKLLSRLHTYVSDPQFDPKRVSRVCLTAAELCSWLHGIYEFGRFSFRPWEVDRIRAKESCQAYLSATKTLCSESCVVPSDADIGAAIRIAEPLTTADVFGQTVCV
eukprot:TRINITY_DN24454_c0_g1_i1.p1 TRINITY_DN24454_c0_g1~~TRINITY_DN24454_c0_g1_i1.p1  ORF type:complete len:342 (+),score=52.03 TRINITY_DN24454_c0_g1_i1:150-1175(+)